MASAGKHTVFFFLPCLKIIVNRQISCKKMTGPQGFGTLKLYIFDAGWRLWVLKAFLGTGQHHQMSVFVMRSLGSTCGISHVWRKFP